MTTEIINNKIIEEIDYTKLLPEKRRTITKIYYDNDRKIQVFYDYINEKGIKYNYDIYIFITRSPTENCQLFSLGQFDSILNFSKEDIALIMGYIKCKITDKRMLLVDLKEHINNSLEEKLYYISTDKQEMKYQSSNGNYMVINVLKLNLDLIINTFKNSILNI